MKSHLLFTTILLFFLVQASQAQDEICNNFFDDDGNGYIDLFDPACEGCFDLTNHNISEDFEEYTCCPDGISDIHCLVGNWQSILATPDYLNTCGFLGETMVPVPLPMPSGEGAIGMGTWNEVLGTCLPMALVPGQEYDISFFVGYNDAGSPGSNLTVEFSIYGAASCLSLETTTSLCFDPQWSEIATFTIVGTVQNSWVSFSSSFITPNFPVEAIAIGHSCDFVSSYGTNQYHFIDDLVINGDFGPYIGASPEIQLYGDCYDGFYIESNIDGPDFQWYFNGAPLAGADEIPLLIDANLTGFYQIATDDHCNNISAPIFFDNNFVPPIILIGDCFSGFQLSTTTVGDTYQWYLNGDAIAGANSNVLDIDATEPGVYQVLVKTEYCDLLSNLLEFEAPLVPSISLSGDCENGFYLESSVEGDTYQWYLNGDPIDGATSNPYLIEGSVEGVYTVSVMTDFCDLLSAEFSFEIDEVPMISLSGDCINGFYLESDIEGTSYEWYLDGDLIIGANSNPLLIEGTEEGEFEVVVITDFCELLSDPFSFEVDEVPMISLSGNCIDGYFLESDMEGDHYQWYFEGEPIPDSDSNPFQIDATQVGEYTVDVITDYCTLTSDPYDFEEDLEVLEVEAEVINISCFGAADGSIILTVNSPNTPFVFDWDNGDNTATIVDLDVGTYTVTVTDANGCYSVTSYEIVQPPELEAELVVTQPSAPAFLGLAEVEIYSGTPPYEAEWSTGDSGLSTYTSEPGIYNVIVTDANGCEVILEFEMYESLDVKIEYETGSCGSACEGYIEILEISGGQPGYTINWSIGGNGQIIENLCDGAYSFTITDIAGTEYTESINLNGDGMTMLVNSTYESFLCNVDIDTDITLIVSGGTPPYHYLWNTGATSSILEHSSAGNYSVVITDADGCSIEEDYTITLAPPLEISSFVGLVSCGNSNGSIDVTVNTGIMPLSYLWSNDDTTEDINNLDAGSYSLTITDGNDCEWINNFNVNSDSDLEVSYEVQEEYCIDLANGSISLDIEGGTAPYTIVWDSGDEGELITNLTAGVYIVTVTDDSGCEWGSSIEVVTSPGIEMEATISDIACFGNADGQIVLDITGNNEPYTFDWSNGSSDQDQMNLSDGVYDLNLIDGLGCEYSYSYTIAMNPELILTGTVVDIPCFGGSDGSILLDVSGGIAPYDILWSNGDTDLLTENLSVGDYDVTITDAMSCEKELSFTVNEATDISVVIDQVVNPSSAGNDGAITIKIDGGMAPYEILWNTGDTNLELNSIGYGTYNVTVTDANGCTQTLEVVFTATSLSYIGSKVDNKCYGDCLGKITLSISEGLMPYSVVWSSGDTGAELNNLCSGSYGATITDALGNELITDIYVIESPDAINIDGVVFDISCIDMNDGEIEVTASGGSMPFYYSWNNSQTGNKIDHLSSGTYEVTVIDENECINTSDYTLADIELVELNLEIGTFDCDDLKTDIVINGDNMYDYPIFMDGNEQVLDADNKISNVAPGSHTISYQINDNCFILIDEIDISNPNEYDVQLDVNAVHVSKGSVVQISLDIISNQLLNGYTIEWETLNSYDCVESLNGDQCRVVELTVDEPEVLEVIFTDDRGCTKTLLVDISLISIIDVYIPNVFSPDNDGNHDYFDISTNTSGLVVNSFVIFDRWGNLLYEVKNQLLADLIPWDGKIDGVTASVGVYVYLLELETIDGEEIVEIGDVTLIR